jgi:hypothetical protein
MNIGMGGEGCWGGGKKGHKARTPSLTLLKNFIYGYTNVVEFFSGAECALKTWLETLWRRIVKSHPYMARTIMAPPTMNKGNRT